MNKSRISNLLISLVICVLLEIITYNLTKNWLFITSVVYFGFSSLALESVCNLKKKKDVKLNICKLALSISALIMFLSFYIGIFAEIFNPINMFVIFTISFVGFLTAASFLISKKW